MIKNYQIQLNNNNPLWTMKQMLMPLLIRKNQKKVQIMNQKEWVYKMQTLKNWVMYKTIKILQKISEYPNLVLSWIRDKVLWIIKWLLV